MEDYYYIKRNLLIEIFYNEFNIQLCIYILFKSIKKINILSQKVFN